MTNDNPIPKNDRPPFKRVWFWVTIGVSFVLCTLGFILMFKSIFDLAAEESTNRPGNSSGFILNYEEDDDGDDDDWYYDYDDDDDKLESLTQTYNIGEAAKAGDITITVTSVDRNYSTGNRFDLPDDGMEYVKVNLILINNSKNRIDYNPFDFELENGEGDIQDYASSLQDDHIGSGSLAPGGKKTGSLIFEVPTGDTKLTLHYDDYSNGEASIKLY